MPPRTADGSFAAHTTGSIPCRSAVASLNRAPNSTAMYGCMCRRTARPPRRFTPWRRSLRALEPVRMNCWPPFRSISRCTISRRTGNFWISSITTCLRPAFAASTSFRYSGCAEYSAAPPDSAGLCEGRRGTDAGTIVSSRAPGAEQEAMIPSGSKETWEIGHGPVSAKWRLCRRSEAQNGGIAAVLQVVRTVSGLQ